MKGDIVFFVHQYRSNPKEILHVTYSNPRHHRCGACRLPSHARSGQEATRRRTPNMYRLLANSPAALEGYLGLSGALDKGMLPAPTRERIALAVAEINGSQLLSVRA